MQNAARIDLLARVARFFFAPGPVQAEKPISILSLAAASYGARPTGDATVPTGFDPIAVTLFEAIVEGAYLVANADGVFDEGERRAFASIVLAACGATIRPQQIEPLVLELGQLLREHGMAARIAAVARAVTKNEHAHEILRVAALLAQATDDVSAVERRVLVKLALSCGLEERDVDAALTDVASLLAVPASPG